MGEFSKEVQEILDRVMAAPVEPPPWAVPQRQPQDGGRRRGPIEQERARVLDQLERAGRAGRHVGSALFEEARQLVLRRLDSGWKGSGHQVTLRRKYQHPIDRGADGPVIVADPVEQLIMSALSLTSPAKQYGVASNMLVFTASVNGWSKDSERVWLSGLSPLIDDVGQFYSEWRASDDGHLGGRFFERNGSLFDANRHKTFLRVTTAG